ncbi:MAG TPA: twin-arginine translocation signal domain-containing protein [Firmicutes bacterium]|nr:twin-arginine translocation signal domain-containing protein [Bacillota bacterium]
MQLTRRSFLKLTGATAAAATLAGVGLNKASASTIDPLRIKYTKEFTTVCTFCGVGCGVVCHVRDGVIVNAEGDPDHPINEGTLCSKGSSHYNISYIYDEKGKPKPNPNRLTHVLYRAPGSSSYEEKDWDWALDTIARRIKDTRDQNYVESVNVDGRQVTVNRTEAISWLGSAFCTDEENYLFHKMARAMGVINLDHCARL